MAGMSTEQSEFSVGQRVGFVMSAALTLFTSSVDGMRHLMDGAARTDGRRPAALEARARDLGRYTADQAGEAAISLCQGVIGTIKQDLENEGIEEPKGRHHPPAREQLGALVAIANGPENTLRMGLEYWEKCGGNPEAAMYGLDYALWKTGPPASTKLATALVPSLVSEFQELLGALYRQWLTMNPGAVGKKQTSMEDLLEYETKDDLLRRAIDERVHDIVDRVPEEWAERIKQDMGISVGELCPDWEQICEVFARRNAIVHAGGRVDDTYIMRTGSDLIVGEILNTDAEYFEASAGTFEALGVRLTVLWFARLTPEGPAPANFAAPHIYTCLKSRDWEDALVLATAVLRGREQSDLPDVVVVNWWMARRESGEGVEGIRDEVIAWVPTANEPGLELARTALLLDVEGFRQLLADPRIRSGLTPTVKEWPLVTRMFETSPELRAFFPSSLDARKAASRAARPRKKGGKRR